MGITRLRSYLVLAGLIVAYASGSSLLAAVPTEPAKIAPLVGQPTGLAVQPESITLTGPRALQQIVVTGKYADGTVRDLTPFCEIDARGRRRRNDRGRTGAAQEERHHQPVVKAGGQTAKVPVVVKDFDKPQPVSFRHELIAALNVGGCNAGACHGTPSGKNGFKLSLRGYDPAADYLQLTRDVLRPPHRPRRPGRQPDPAEGPGPGAARGRPCASADAAVPAQVIRAWLAEGLAGRPADAAGPAGHRRPARLARPQRAGPLAAAGRPGPLRRRQRPRRDPADGLQQQRHRRGRRERQRAWSSSARPAKWPSCAAISMQLQTVRLTYLEPRQGFVWTNPPENNYVDKHVFAKLKMLSIPPSDLCTDQEFVRRAYLDLCGILPTPERGQGVPGRHRPRTSGPS